MRQLRNFIVQNEGFVCLNCGREVQKHLHGGCRNHCNFCLFSLHLDAVVPGDRNSSCAGLMTAIGVEQEGKKGFIIKHRCQKCGKILRNLTAPDDNQEQIIILTQIPHARPYRRRAQKFS